MPNRLNTTQFNMKTEKNTAPLVSTIAGGAMQLGAAYGRGVKKLANKAIKNADIAQHAETVKNTIVIPLTADGGLPVSPGNKPQRTIKGKYNPLYGKWRQVGHKFQGNLAEQRIIQSNARPDAVGHQTFTNNFKSDVLIPGRRTRATPYNRTSNRAINAAHEDANRVEHTAFSQSQFGRISEGHKAKDYSLRRFTNKNPYI